MTVREFISYLDKDKVANAKIAFRVYEDQKWFFYCDPKEKTYDEFMSEDFYPMGLEIDSNYVGDDVKCITGWEEDGAVLLFVFNCIESKIRQKDNEDNRGDE